VPTALFARLYATLYRLAGEGPPGVVANGVCQLGPCAGLNYPI